MKTAPVVMAAGAVAVTALVGWFGVRAIGAEVWRAAWAVPPIIALHAVQLWLSALAWRITTGASRPGLGRWLHIRWLREAVNSMLPVAQLGGNLAGIRLLAQAGVPGSLAAAGTTIDLTIEAGTQFLFTLAGIGVLAVIGAEDTAVASWLGGGLAAMGLGLAGFIAAQRYGLLTLVERMVLRLQRFFP
ncbi:MAG TPA: lysylphosphatidylglycerol synthase domain-containing protein, partial [Acetobacteraceae bacterium]